MYNNWDKLYKRANRRNFPEVKGEVACFGMGGSGVICDIMNAFYPFKKDIEDTFTLIAISYSGNTRETLQVVNEALQDGKKVIVITSGGQLEKLAEDEDIYLILLRKGYQTRYAFPLLFLPVVKMLRPDLAKDVIEGVNSEKATNLAKELLEFIRGKIPVFYGSTYLGLAKRFKQEINENAKWPAFFGEIPEVYHNEVESYKHGEMLAPVVFSSSEEDELLEKVTNAKIIKVSGIRDVSLLV